MQARGSNWGQIFFLNIRNATIFLENVFAIWKMTGGKAFVHTIFLIHDTFLYRKGQDKFNFVLR